jgi:hypothetical protein
MFVSSERVDGARETWCACSLVMTKMTIDSVSAKTSRGEELAGNHILGERLDDR